MTLFFIMFACDLGDLYLFGDLQLVVSLHLIQ